MAKKLETNTTLNAWATVSEEGNRPETSPLLLKVGVRKRERERGGEI